MADDRQYPDLMAALLEQYRKPQPELRAGDPAAFREPTLLSALLGRYAPSGWLSANSPPQTRDEAQWQRRVGGLLDDMALGPMLRPFTQFAMKPPLPRHERFDLPIRDKAGAPVGNVYGNVAGDTAYVEGAFRQPPVRGPMAFEAWMAREYPSVKLGASDLAPYKAAYENQAPKAYGMSPNSVGYREMRRIFDSIRDRYPQTSRVLANRVSGARHGPSSSGYGDDATDTLKQRLWEPGNIMDEMLGQADRLAKGRISEGRVGDAIERYAEKVLDGGPNLDIQLQPEWRRILDAYGRPGLW